jgi:hypothetical protein
MFAVNAVTVAGPDPAKHLGVEVNELSGSGSLVADDGLPRFETSEPR